jgi:hypothetical protein
MCPARCSFAQCYRDTYEFTSDPALVLDATVDRTQALKQGCLWRTFFLENGPRLEPDAAPESAAAQKERLLESQDEA